MKDELYTNYHRRKIQEWLKRIGRHHWEQSTQDLIWLSWAIETMEREVHPTDWKVYGQFIKDHKHKVLRGIIRRLKALPEDEKWSIFEKL